MALNDQEKPSAEALISAARLGGRAALRQFLSVQCALDRRFQKFQTGANGAYNTEAGEAVHPNTFALGLQGPEGELVAVVASMHEGVPPNREAFVIGRHVAEEMFLAFLEEVLRG